LIILISAIVRIRGRN